MAKSLIFLLVAALTGCTAIQSGPPAPCGQPGTGQAYAHLQGVSSGDPTSISAEFDWLAKIDHEKHISLTATWTAEGQQLDTLRLSLLDHDDKAIASTTGKAPLTFEYEVVGTEHWPNHLTVAMSPVGNDIALSDQDVLVEARQTIVC